MASPALIYGIEDPHGEPGPSGRLPGLPRTQASNDMQAEVILNSDYFRIFVFKVEKCSQIEPHDWTVCQFAHPTEKAKRRDPTKHVYNHNSCTEFRKHGSCRSGDNCAFAHGVFEGWLSPSKYHTEMCTLGRQSCSRRVCFFAHSLSELREVVPKTLQETEELRDQLLAAMFIEPVYAKKLEHLLSVMTPAQAAEVIGEKLAYLQFFLNQFGLIALPALLNLSQSDLQDLMSSMRDQAQREVSQQNVDPQIPQSMAEIYMGNPAFQQLPNVYPAAPLSEVQAANLLSQIAVNNTTSSEDQYSARSSLESYLAPTASQHQFLTPPRRRGSRMQPYPGSWGESSLTREAHSSLDLMETNRHSPEQTRLRTGNLFRQFTEGLENLPLPRLPGRHSLDNAYQHALQPKGSTLAQRLSNPAMQLPMQYPLKSLPVTGDSIMSPLEALTSSQNGLPLTIRHSGPSHVPYNLGTLPSITDAYGSTQEMAVRPSDERGFGYETSPAEWISRNTSANASIAD